MDIKNDLSTEVRALTKRMSHIDEQIGQIFNFLSPINTSVTNNFSSNGRTTLSIPSQSQSPPPPSSISPLTIAISPETNVSSVSITPSFEAPSFYSDLSAKMALFDPSQPSSTITDVDDLRRQSRTSEHSLIRQLSDQVATTISIPPPPSVYNRSTSSSMISLGASITSRNSISNRIAPAPPSPVSPKHPLNTTFQPISNTRFNPGRSPKPKTRSHHGRTSSKNQQQSIEKSTIIDLEPPVQQDVSSKSDPLLSTPTKTISTAKSSGNVFRRFMTGGNNTDKTAMSSSSTLLYPTISDDEHPMSPISSGNEDDDYRPLTSSSSSSKHHHQTPL